MKKPRKAAGGVKKRTTPESTVITQRSEASTHKEEKASKQPQREVTDDELEAVMIKMVNERGSSKTCCPSEVPRRILGEQGPWRNLMARTRAIAIRLSKAGALVITQKGQVVDVKHQSEIRGPIRISGMIITGLQAVGMSRPEGAVRSMVEDASMDDGDLCLVHEDQEDLRFDSIVGALQEVLMDPSFVTMQEDFYRQHAESFDEDCDESKLEHTDIFNRYTQLTEEYLEEILQQRFPDVTVEDFVAMAEAREDQCVGDVWDLLVGMADFQEFKENMYAYKRGVGRDVNTHHHHQYDHDACPPRGPNGANGDDGGGVGGGRGGGSVGGRGAKGDYYMSAVAADGGGGGWRGAGVTPSAPIDCCHAGR